LVDADSAHVVVSVSDVAADDKALIPTVDRIARQLRAKLGERGSAIQTTRELMQVITPSLEAYRSLMKGNELLWGGENRAAITWCRKALAIDPDFVSPWAVMGFCYGNLSEPDSSLAAFRQALARPERLSDRARFDVMGTVALLSGDLAGALATNE